MQETLVASSCGKHSHFQPYLAFNNLMIDSASLEMILQALIKVQLRESAGR